MAVPSPYGQAVSTEELRRQIAAKVRRRRWAYVAVFLVAVALGGAFIVIRLIETPQWWAYNTSCGATMIAVAGVFLWLVYRARRDDALDKVSSELFRRK